MIITLYFTSNTYAGSKTLALELAQAHQYPKMFDNFINSCLRTKKMSAYDLYEANPKYFGGLSPNSKYWSEIEKVTNQYWQDVCQYMSEGEMTDIFIDHYQKEFTDSELIELIDFYSSELGQKIANTNLKANFDFQDFAYSAMSKKSGEAGKLFLEKLQVIIDKENQ